MSLSIILIIYYIVVWSIEKEHDDNPNRLKSIKPKAFGQELIWEFLSACVNAL